MDVLYSMYSNAKAAFLTMIYYFSLPAILCLLSDPGVKIFLRIVNLLVNVADKNIKAIFLADSSCRVSLLDRSCFFIILSRLMPARIRI